MSGRSDPGFDRLRRRTPDGVDDLVVINQAVPDTDGKRALFSAAEQKPSFGSVSLTCSSCGERSIVSARQALRLAVPSVHLPFLRQTPWSWMRCPACGRRTWVDVTIQL
jgi:predicted RNA-binding Zn-ribbon protein involved in translation (DUF1610 family)